MKRLVFFAQAFALAIPGAALAQSSSSPSVTVQPVYNAPTSAPLTLDPTGGVGPPLGAAPNPYGGSGPVPGAPAPPQYVTSPSGALQPEASATGPTGLYLGLVPFERQAEAPADQPIPNTHVVQKGDTLWEICALYFRNPWRWPEIWGLNPQITNPHWIYPGNVVRLQSGGEAPVAAPVKGKAPPPNLIEKESFEEALLRQIAFVGLADLRAAGTVSGSTDEKVMLSTGDDIFISYPEGKPPQLNTRYSIYVPDRDIYEPGSKKLIGKYVVIRGEVVITEVKKGKDAKGIITDMTDQGIVEREQKVGPLKTQLRSMDEVAPTASVEGTVAGVLQGTDIIGLGMVVFVDRGRADGVRAGNRMVVVRRGDAYPEFGALTTAKDDHRFPDTDYGSVLILDVGERTSVAWMSRTDTDIQVGDHVVMRASK